MTVKVGCCGFAVRGGRKAYYRVFSLVEVQSTFYQLPRVETVRRWRTEAPEAFEFTLKAWQAITHPSSSPTWRRIKPRPPADRVSSYGYLKPTPENVEAWGMVSEIAKALRAEIVVVQCPPSFKATEENIVNVKRFFRVVDVEGLTVAWEPRHSSWSTQVVRDVCEEAGLVHVVDPFKSETATRDRSPVYFRLHGLGRRPYIYKYTGEDLEKLYREYVAPLDEAGLDVYILWNNVHMAEDALRFKNLYLR